jgi:hypothetical protein
MAGGLYKFANPVVIRSLKPPGLISTQPLNLKRDDIPVSKSICFFKCNLLPLRRGEQGRGAGGRDRRRRQPHRPPGRHGTGAVHKSNPVYP